MKKYTLFIIAVHLDTLPEDFTLGSLTFQNAEIFGTKIKTSENIQDILDCLISDLNSEMYTSEENYLVVFENDKLLIY